MKKKQNVPLRECMNIFTWLLAAVLLCATVFFWYLAYRQAIVVFSREYKKAEPAQETEKEQEIIDAHPYAQKETLLKETPDAGREYIDTMLFFGDSNTARFLLYHDAEGMTCTSVKNTAAVIGMGIQSIDNLKCMRFKDKTVTMTETAARLQPQRIFITMGTNNMHGTIDADALTVEYEEKLRKIQEASPSSALIVSAIPPIAENCKYRDVTMEAIDAWNAALLPMCERNGWHFLNTSEVLKDPLTGYAREGLMDGDGLHLKEEGVQTLFAYIRTHALVNDEAGLIPFDDSEVKGPLTELLLNQ